jgi:hypothetical protein
MKTFNTWLWSYSLNYTELILIFSYSLNYKELILMFSLFACVLHGQLEKTSVYK